MLKNNLKLAIRHLQNSKTSTLINVFGLALGLAAAFFIWQYIRMENSYDQFHDKADRIYRMTLKFYGQGRLEGHDAMNVAPLGPALAEDFPEVESYVRFTPEYGRTVFKYGDQQYEEEKMYYADSTLFEVFDFPLIEGDRKTCLTRPFTTLLTESVAERYFGPRASWTESPVGKVIRVNNRGDLEVTGILEDVPENSHLKFNMLVSFNTFLVTNGDPTQQWGWNDFFTFVLLRENVDPAAFAAKLPDFNKKRFVEKTEGFYSEAVMQPLLDIHLNSKLGYEAEPNGDGNTVYFLFLIGIVVVIVAWVNYINLATARAEERAREVGVRKVIGANQGTLVAQFLTEAFLVNLVAILLAVCLVQLGQPAMDTLVGKTMPSIFAGPTVWWLLPTLLLAGTVLSGLYPAFFLATFSPAKTLKGEKQRRGKGVLRKGLVTFQYAVSVALIIGTVVIFLQLRYMKNQDLGFALDQQLIINAPTSLDSDSVYRAHYQSFKMALNNIPEIEQIGASSAIPGKKYLDIDAHGGIRMMSADKEKNVTFKGFVMDEGFLEVFGMELLAGRNFSDEMSTDKDAIILTESALPMLELEDPESAIGKTVNYQGSPRSIVGVVADYHHRSLQHAYEPMILRNSGSNYLYFSLGLAADNATEVSTLIGKVEQTWSRFFPNNPFNYFFLDDHFNEQYIADQRLGNIIAIFSSLAILIACLGLFGLASYMVTVRTKEIGIRKVLGASTAGLVGLLSRDFLLLVGIAILIASPLAWWLMDTWLENFAYRIHIQWWVFALTGLVALSIAFFTVSLQSVKAALANPIDSLKSE
ncbi:ABC transporter permease [Flavilitoribacter nigricans]|nr:ABC transporter permease [Flavilitoribacter nigricans]